MLDCAYEGDASVSWRAVYEAYYRAQVWTADRMADPASPAGKARDEEVMSAAARKYRHRAESAAELDVWKIKQDFQKGRTSKIPWTMFHIRKYGHILSGIRAEHQVLQCPRPKDLTSVDPHLLYYAWDVGSASKKEISEKATARRHKLGDAETGFNLIAKRQIVSPVLVPNNRPLPKLPAASAVHVNGVNGTKNEPTQYPLRDRPSHAHHTEVLHEVDESSDHIRVYRPSPAIEQPSSTHQPAQTRPVAIVDGKPMLESSEEELAAFSIILGIEIEMAPRSYLPNGRGGFGCLLLSSQCRGQTNFRLLNHRTANKSAQPKGRNVHSTLFAKHIACGCIPFARGETDIDIKTLAITPSVAKSIEAGFAVCDHLSDDWRWDHPAFLCLENMPAAAKIIDYFGSGYRSSDEHLEYHHGTFWTHATPRDAEQLACFDWPSTVTQIAFGGLVPMASGLLVKLVSFTIGMPEHREDIDAMTALIEETDLQIKQRAGASHLCVFGPKLQRHEVANRARVHVNSSGVLCHAFHRTTREIMEQLALYTTLLEALLAMVDLDAATTHERNGAYIEAGEVRREAVFKEARNSIWRAYHDRVTQPYHVHDGISMLLARPLDEIRGFGKLSAQSCGVVARCIIMAWTHFVRRIEWADSDADELKDSPTVYWSDEGAKQVNDEGTMIKEKHDSMTLHHHTTAVTFPADHLRPEHAAPAVAAAHTNESKCTTPPLHGLLASYDASSGHYPPGKEAGATKSADLAPYRPPGLRDLPDIAMWE